MRDQIKLIFNMGAETISPVFKDLVIREATALCGGCCTHNATGWWREDGAMHRPRFTGAMGQEDAFIVELTCEPHKVESVYQSMQQAIASAAYDTNTNVDWVHVSEIPMRGRHFSVAAMNAAQAA